MKEVTLNTLIGISDIVEQIKIDLAKPKSLKIYEVLQSAITTGHGFSKINVDDQNNISVKNINTCELFDLSKSWIETQKKNPDLIEGKDYSKNVWG